MDDLRGYTLLDRRMKGCHNIHQIHAKYKEREKEREREKVWIGRGNNAECDIFYDRGYVHIHKRWHRDIFLIFVFFQTPLHFAALNGYGDVMEILLCNGANIHEKDVRNDRNEKWWRRWKD